MKETIYDISANRIDGTRAKLADYAGKVLLIVNVASECGFTPQYEGLEQLYEAQHDRGLEVLGFPTNDFGAQEPGSNAEVATFCTNQYGVRFPMFEKISVKDDARHPLYRRLIEAQPEAREKPGDNFHKRMAEHGVAPDTPDGIMWNFEKFLVGRDGRVVGRFTSDVAPDDPMLLSAIDGELQKPG